MYCAKFVHTLIRISNCKYNLRFYIVNHILQYTLPYLQCATEQETVNLSVFINMLIQPFANWNDESKYRGDMKNYFSDNEKGQETKYDKEKSYII
jgi:Transcription factor/nuclear export subunit protein 2